MANISTSVSQKIADLRSKHLPAGLAIYKTPLVYLKTLSKEIGSQVYIKRDDWGDIALSGAKARKLNFILTKVLAMGYKKVAACGPETSNSCRALAAACAPLGIEAHLFLRGRDAGQLTGNASLAKAMGAKIHWKGLMDWDALDAASKDWCAENEAYPLNPGGTEPLGVLGVLLSYLDFVSQCEEMSLSPKTIFHASATGGVSAALRLGSALQRVKPTSQKCEIHSIAVVRNLYAGSMSAKYDLIAKEAMDFLGLSEVERLSLDFAQVGRGYPVVTARAKAACHQFLRFEGIPLDPIYVGRAAAALIDHAKSTQGPHVLWHTGGIAGMLNDRLISKVW